MPHAGGSAAAYKSWLNSFPYTIQVCPVELPGRGTRFKDPPNHQLMPLARAICQGIVPYLDRPFAIFGHSMGGRLGFEVCRILEESLALRPLVFFASGTSAPTTPEVSPAHNLPDKELIARLRELSQSRGIAFDYPELIDLILPVLRADLSVSETYIYQPGPHLTCPLVVLGGTSDPETTQEGLEEWRAHSLDCKIKMIPGHHFFIDTEKVLVHKIILDEILLAQSRAAEDQFGGQGMSTLRNRDEPSRA